MGTVASTDGKSLAAELREARMLIEAGDHEAALARLAGAGAQGGLSEQLADARALIEAGEYEPALGRLEAAREIARAQRDVDRLDEVRMLARRVSGRASRMNDRRRADDLEQGARGDLVFEPHVRSVAPPSERQVLADGLVEARVLVERGEAGSALRSLERVRREALAGQRLADLERVLEAAAFIYRRTEGKRRSEAGRLAFAAQQNVRFVGRKRALAEGREWVDPFPPAVRPLEVTEGRFVSATRFLEPGKSNPPSLARSLLLSSLFCGFLALVGILGAHTLREWYAWMGFFGVYWLLFVVLQVWWWRRGYEYFWRPVYPSVLFVGLCATVFLLPSLLVPKFRRWLFGNMYPGPRRTGQTTS